MTDLLRVLLVEDNPGDAGLARIALRQMPGATAEIELVVRLSDAIDAIREDSYDVVLLDLSLPDSHGVETLVRLHAEEPDVPVIVLTGHDDQDVALAAMEAGAQDFIEKSRLDNHTLARAIRYARERHRLLAELRQLVVIDELTDVHNRRGFLGLAESHVGLSNRTGESLALLFVDLDEMKAINDTHGHQAGDEALRASADLLIETFRTSDVVGRVGGDEFCVLLTPGGWTDTSAAVRRLEENLAKLNAAARLPYRLGLSVGVAEYQPTEPCTLDELLERADGAMYERKQARRACR